MPSARVWKAYRVLAVAANFEESDVLEILKNEKAQNVISLSGQGLPVTSANEKIFSLSAYLSYGSNYLEERKNYFFDKNQAFKLYYVPKEFGRAAERAAKSLRGRGVEASLDTNTNFPWLAPLVCLAAFGLLLALSRRKIIFCGAAVFPLLLSWALPFYEVALSVSVLLPALFCVVELLDRKHGFDFLLRNPVMVLLAVSFVSCVLKSLLAAGLWLLCVASAVFFLALVFFSQGGEKNQLSSIVITPVHIAYKNGKNFKKVFAVSCVEILVLALCFFAFSQFVPSASKLELPAKNATSDTRLPGLNDYLAWHWKTKTFPYREVQSVPYAFPQDGETVVFPRYAQNGTMIKHVDDVIFVFDEAYRQTAVREIDEIAFPAIEKLLRQEGVYRKIGYAAGRGDTDLLKTSVLFVVAFCACVAVYFAYKIYTEKSVMFMNLR